jgi:hypothetical protein
MRGLTRSALIGLATLAIASATSASATVVSGLQGVVYKGPIRPVCSVEEPCDAPTHVTLIFTRYGKSVRVPSAANGRYRALLVPGIYRVTTLERIGISRNIRPQNVKVRRGHVDRLDFFIDTGIR